MRLPLQAAPVRHQLPVSMSSATSVGASQDCPGGFPCVCSGRTKCCRKGQTCRCVGGLPVCQ